MASIWSAARKLSHSGDMQRSTKSCSAPPQNRQLSALCLALARAERGGAADARSSPPPSARATEDTVGRSRIMLFLARELHRGRKTPFAVDCSAAGANFARGARARPEDPAFPLPNGVPHSLLTAPSAAQTRTRCPTQISPP